MTLEETPRQADTRGVMTTTLLFAYGTLAPSDPDAAARGGWTPDRVRGRLYDLGPYPALVDLDDPEAGWVEGYAGPVSPADLAGRFDRYEGVAEGLYRRAETTTGGGRRAWVYVYARPLPRDARGPIDRWHGPRVAAPRINDDASRRHAMAQPSAPLVSTRDRRPEPGGSTVGQYLIDRLGALGVGHVFGIPGDYVLTLYKMLSESPIRVVGMTREDSAGFAADAYARLNGLGCVCVTYCVGGLSLCNSIAGAYAEKSPVIVLGGSPGLSERARNPLLHHKVKGFETQFEVFEKITVAAAVLDDPLTALTEIDRVLESAVRFKRPVYLEVPRDQVLVRPAGPHRTPAGLPPSDPDALREAVDEAAAMLTSARRPMILADVEVHRFGLQDELLALAEATGMPIATTILGKSVISESHPLFVGVYEGAMGRVEVTEFVEEADCLLMLGCFLTDINLGIFTAKLDPARCINVTSEDLRIRFHHYQDVRLDDFIRALSARGLSVAKTPVPARPDPLATPWVPEKDAPVKSSRLFDRINRMLSERMVVIADIGDSLFGSADLSMSRRTEFVSPAYYTSMGFAVPAAVGTGFANPALRALVIVGDGAFQMTGMELSTIARHGMNPIVIVLNNHGYTTERFLLDGPFNDIHTWRFHKIPEVLGSGLGMEVRTEGELDSALERALAHTESFSLLNVHLDPWDRSPALERLAQRLSKIV
jgi:indolepyruvate decarboxylase